MFSRHDGRPAQRQRRADGHLENVATQLLLPFLAGHLLRPWIGALVNRAIVASPADHRPWFHSPFVYGAFSAAWSCAAFGNRSPPLLVLLLLVMAVLLSVALLYIRPDAVATLSFDRADEAAFVFIGSQKSLVSGIPIANALIPGPAIGPILVCQSCSTMPCNF